MKRLLITQFFSRLLLFVLVSCMSLFLVPPTFAQSLTVTSCAVTKVGNPTGDSPPLPPECTTQASGSLSTILDWDVKINNALEVGNFVWPDGSVNTLYNRMVADISNGTYAAVKRQGLAVNTDPEGIYWCTNSVIDSYNLAGIKGLGDNQQAVVSMRDFWKTASGYRYVDGNDLNSINAVSPGYAMFMEEVPGKTTDHEHVDIIKTKTIDDQGNGFIETYDSNSSQKSHKFTVVNGSVINTPYPVRGFGGV